MKMTAVLRYSAVYSRGSSLMMEAVRTSETSVYFLETTRRYIPFRNVVIFELSLT
jgi:hypothetical protein